jgi:transcriptional regulator with XRE-family HTH domain
MQLPNLPAKIKSAREAAGLSQRELGAILKLSDRTISAYEVGRAEPSLAILQQMSHVVHQPILYFLDDQSDSVANSVAIKLARIEQDLAEIKELLAKRST